MLALLSALGSLLSFRVRSRLTLELELVALRHQSTLAKLIELVHLADQLGLTTSALVDHAERRARRPVCN